MSAGVPLAYDYALEHLEHLRLPAIVVLSDENGEVLGVDVGAWQVAPHVLARLERATGATREHLALYFTVRHRLDLGLEL